MTKELNFSFFLIVIHFSVSSHVEPVAVALESTGVEQRL